MAKRPFSPAQVFFAGETTLADDPYKVLGVARTASQDEIRKAYHKLAKQLHPDLNPGDKSAEERFKQVAAAYHLLHDPEQRKRYDAGRVDADGAERQQHYYREYAGAKGGRRYASSAGMEDFADFSDIFAQFFRQQGEPMPDGSQGPDASRGFRMRGQDARYHLDVDFLDAVRGAKPRITLPNGQTLDVRIPVGIKDGATLRLKGKGGPGFGGGPQGDALVEVGVRPHPVFRRDGDDILMDLPITIDEAVLGGKIQVPTIHGPVTMTIPKGANGGEVLRLKGKGIRKGSGLVGDQRVTLQLVLPDPVDTELADFLANWRRRHGYDPRAALRRAT